MEFVRKNAPGMLICLVIAVPAWLLGPGCWGSGFRWWAARCSPF